MTTIRAELKDGRSIKVNIDLPVKAISIYEVMAEVGKQVIEWSEVKEGDEEEEENGDVAELLMKYIFLIDEVPLRCHRDERDKIMRLRNVIDGVVLKCTNEKMRNKLLKVIRYLKQRQDDFHQCLWNEYAKIYDIEIEDRQHEDGMTKPRDVPDLSWTTIPSGDGKDAHHVVDELEGLEVCATCGHITDAHEYLGEDSAKMPCSVDGCNCEDFYCKYDEEGYAIYDLTDDPHFELPPKKEG